MIAIRGLTHAGKGAALCFKNPKVCLPQTCPSLILGSHTGSRSFLVWESLTWAQLICYKDETCGLWQQADSCLHPDLPLAACVTLGKLFPSEALWKNDVNPKGRS